uniref:Neur_chan_LBD domain-containing protein n=1 Tax=Elaeophora elaphi TaxID=1147741 RepID=A0A0R3RQK6_9BILA
MVWHSDILLYNSGNEKFNPAFKSQILVYSNGEVTWIPPGTFRKIAVTWFPFDSQSRFDCLKFGSWAYNGLALNLRTDAKEGGSKHLSFKCQWIYRIILLVENKPLKVTTLAKHEKIYYCSEPYYFIKFFLNVSRRTIYYGFNIIIPSLLIVVLTTLAFTYLQSIYPKELIFLSSLKFPNVFITVLAASSITFTIAILNICYRSSEIIEIIFVQVEFKVGCPTILTSKMQNIPTQHLFLPQEIGAKLFESLQTETIQYEKFTRYMEKAANLSR